MMEYKYFDCDITEQDLKIGVREDNDRCPLYLAAHRHLSRFSLSGELFNVEYVLVMERSPEAHDFVKAFDAGATLAPQTLKLCYVESYISFGGNDYLRGKH